jgi:hypothetical protein
LAEQRYEAEILAGREPPDHDVTVLRRQFLERNPVHMFSGRLEIRRRLRKLDIDDVDESRYWEAVLG